MERISQFSNNEMTIIQSDRIKTVTCLITGVTKVYLDGDIKDTWPCMTITDFELKQKMLEESAEVLEQFNVQKT